MKRSPWWLRLAAVFFGAALIWGVDGLVVTAIVDLAHAHGMRVIAEGVESGRQARRLREIGCDFAQGFHFGRPGEADRIVRG